VVIAAFGITGVALVQYLYFVAVDRLPVGIALLLEFTAPVLVALFSRFVYREHLLKRVWLGIACSLGGLALVAEIWDGLTLDTIGVLAALGAAVSLATYFLLGEHSVSSDPPLHVLTEAFIVAAVFWNCIRPITALTDEVDLGAMQSFGGNLADISAPIWALLVWLIVGGTLIPFLCELSALQYLTATEVVLISMLEPAGATLLGWLWFDESLSALQVVGVVAVLVGIALAQTARSGPITDQAPMPT
jgi:drug/metabolite transporter (DMT)-like permease